MTLPADLAPAPLALVEKGISRTRAYLEDPEKNIPLDVGEFARRESGLCGHCNFVPLCEQY